MSYLVLARKWRPQTFADVVGQQHVLKALSHSLDNARLHHAYLFAGTRGVGKTTLARILAKALNCERGVSAAPCGECSACHEIDQGRFVDLIEVDAASNTKVEDTRGLLDNVQYAPTRGRYKVYLIDEVHMLSTHSFNALLKTLEEPPPHVKFLLATTDPQKLPVTVLSRCLQFNLKRLTPPLIRDRLDEICTAEGIKAETGALQLMARAADGSLRDALSLMDQAIAYGGGALSEHDVAQMLGALDKRHVLTIIEKLSEHDANGLMATIAEADEQFPDYSRLLDELAEWLTRIAVFKATEATDLDEDDAPQMERLAGLVSAEDAQLWYQIALIGKRDLALAPDPRAGVEMTLLRMLTFRPALTDAGSSPPTAAPDATSAGRSASASPAHTSAASRDKNDKGRPSGNASATPPVPSSQRPDPTAPADLDDWHRLIGQLNIGGVVRLLAANCAYLKRDGDCVHLSLDKRSEAMLTESRIRELTAALSDYLGSDLSLQISIDGVASVETPVQRAARRESEQKNEVRQSLEKDAGVNEMRKLFDAEMHEPVQPGPSASTDSTR